MPGWEDPEDTVDWDALKATPGVIVPAPPDHEHCRAMTQDLAQRVEGLEDLVEASESYTRRLEVEKAEWEKLALRRGRDLETCRKALEAAEATLDLGGYTGAAELVRQSIKTVWPHS